MGRPSALRPSPFAPRARAIFLAPHYDDVALSCGGTVAARAGAGGPPPLVVTVFGGEPEEQELTGFARWQHERWGTAGTDTLATRRAEEATAAAFLGCATHSLPYRDAIYRGDHYLSDPALFGTPHPDDAPLAARIAADVLALPELAGAAPPTTLFVPLAIGGHVDHQLVLASGRIVAGTPGWPVRVLAYEDFPYTLLGDARAPRLAAVAGEVGAADRGDRSLPFAAADHLPALRGLARRARGLRPVARRGGPTRRTLLAPARPPLKRMRYTSRTGAINRHPPPARVATHVLHHGLARRGGEERPS